MKEQNKMKKDQEFKIIIDAIRLTERFYPEKVVIEQDKHRLKVYSPEGTTFRNTDIISTVNTLKVTSHIVYDHELNKVVLLIF